jgi:cyclopropane fatty-acyl-phospholipid synthase-like methyltransferase
LQLRGRSSECVSATSARHRRWRPLIQSAFSSGGEQNFLGARWVPVLARSMPERWQKQVALRLLALSPHYFFGDVEMEAERNRSTRQQIVDDLIAPHLEHDYHVLDYGCGPGYMANAAAAHVQHVDAVDVSEGALACARILNPRSNVRYLNVKSKEFRTVPDGTYDLAYSFAVAQHLTDALCAQVLRIIAGKLKSGAPLLLHVVLDDARWRTEDEWRRDRTLRGRVRFRYGLRCFRRTAGQVERLLRAAGFEELTIDAIRTRSSVADDIAAQHLFTAIRG